MKRHRAFSTRPTPPTARWVPRVSNWATRWLAGLIAATVLLLTAGAHADTVLLLPAKGQVPGKAITGVLARESRYAIIELGHHLVSNEDTQAAIRSVEDGNPDNADEYEQMTKQTHADWLVIPRILPFPPGYGLELTAYQASSGRTETVTREIETGKIHEQVVEMAKLLLRPQGIGTDPLPWEKAPSLPPPSNTHSQDETQVQTVEPSRNNEPSGQFLLGLGGGATACVSSGCPGDLHLMGELSLGWRTPIGLVVQADVRDIAAESNIVHIEGAVRYAVPLSPTLSLGAEAAVGDVLSPTQAITLRGSPVVELKVNQSVRVLATLGDATWMHASGNSIVSLGGTFRGAVAF